VKEQNQERKSALPKVTWLKRVKEKGVRSLEIQYSKKGLRRKRNSVN
jgi:hypothetical protein